MMSGKLDMERLLESTTRQIPYNRLNHLMLLCWLCYDHKKDLLATRRWKSSANTCKSRKWKQLFLVLVRFARYDQTEGTKCRTSTRSQAGRARHSWHSMIERLLTGLHYVALYFWKSEQVFQLFWKEKFSTFKSWKSMKFP